MKKSTKIILPALALLVLGTTAAATSTVAWFAANGTVSATGMQVKCQTSHNLIISNTDPAKFNGSTADDTNYGSSVSTTNTGAHSLTPSSTATSVLKSGTPGFFYAETGSPINAVSGAIDVNAVLKAGTNNNHYAQHDFWVANSATDNMDIAISEFKITRATETKDQSAITDALRIAIVYEDNTKSSDKNWCTIFTATSGATSTYQGFIKAATITAIPAGNVNTYSGKTTTDGTAETISEEVTTQLFNNENAYAMGQILATKNAVASAKDYNWSKLTVYTWYEGQDKHCTSNYAMSVENISIELSFTADATTQTPSQGQGGAGQ